MSIKDKTKVGSRGEILPKLPLREFAGISPGDSISIEASPGQLIIRKILTIDEVFDLPKITSYSQDELNEALILAKKEQANLVE